MVAVIAAPQRGMVRSRSWKKAEWPWLENRVESQVLVEQPFYYRFSLHPEDGEVELAHNYEDVPSRVRYHSELGDSDTYHGFAYRIKGGWRLTDWDHKPINDPFVVASVIRAIREQEGSYLPHEDAGWETVAPSYDRWHYGLPMGSSQNAEA
jgi:hypothetical protein